MSMYPPEPSFLAAMRAAERDCDEELAPHTRREIEEAAEEERRRLAEIAALMDQRIGAPE